MSDNNIHHRDLAVCHGRVRRHWHKFIRAVLSPFRPSIVRVWRLGSLDHGIMPTAAAFDHFVRLLLAAAPDDDLDIVWDPAISVLELKGTGEVNIVTGPGIRVTREGNVVKVEKEGPEEALAAPYAADMGGAYDRAG